MGISYSASNIFFMQNGPLLRVVAAFGISRALRSPSLSRAGFPFSFARFLVIALGRREKLVSET